MRRALSILLRVLMSVGLLYLVARKIPFAHFVDALRRVNIPLMLASYLFIPIMGYIDANRTKIMADFQGMTLSINQIVRINFITSFYSLFLPGYLAGGVIRWHRMARHDNKPAQAFATILYTRLLSTLIMALVGLACWLVDTRARVRTPGLGIGLGVLFLLLCFAYWVLFSTGRSQWAADWISRRKFVPRLVVEKMGKLLRSVGKFDEVVGWRLGSTVALLVLSEVVGIASFYAVSVAMHLELSPITVGWVRAYINLLTLLPITIMGLGVRDGSLVVMLGAYGIAPALALTFSVLLLTRTIVLGLLGGACELWNIMRFRFTTSEQA